MSNPYELYSSEKTEEVTKEIESVLLEAAKKLVDLQKKYPAVGLGDTATDEAIAGDFYSILHSQY